MHSFVVNKEENYNQIASTNTPLKYLDSSMITPSMTEIVQPTRLLDYSKIDIPIEKENFTLKNDIIPTRLNDVESWVFVPPTVVVRKREVADHEDKDEKEEKGELIDLPLEEDNSNETYLFKREIIKPEQQPPVQVHIQNVTEVS